MAGVVQFDVQKGETQKNLNIALGFLETLADQGVKLAVLPEMFPCSFDNENLKRHSQENGKILELLGRFAAQKQMAIAGTLPLMRDDRIYNTMVLIDVDGQIKGRYEKLHLFRLTDEHLYYTAGNQVVTVNTGFGRIGMMTCYDLRFPELARSLFLKQVQMILISAQWPEPRKEHWATLVRARAVENQVFMVCSNRTGKEDGLKFPGMSMVVDPMGKVLADAGGSDGCRKATIDLSQVESARTLIPCMTDRRQDIYG